MEYTQDSERFVTTGSSSMAASQPLPWNKDRKIRCTRKVLLIVLGMLLSMAILRTIFIIVDFGATNHSSNSMLSVQFGQSVISVILYSFGYLVTHRYSKIGLRVFAWLNIIDLVIVGIALAILFVSVSTFLSTRISTLDGQHQGIGIGLSIVVFVAIILIIAAFILQIIIVKLAFKLARLIEAKKFFLFAANLTV
ncbi:unnamed protein product [Rotaria magnacalcarata]|uniref:Uncharacterized protein n=1 Tax=Rotaria magnacalcarata TaxID=392030 RepID=A0A816N6M1_9BILA|nr:unnamed protein product [Rotaria magnacalcarata]